MKKIVLFAAATMAVSSALAVAPAKKSAALAGLDVAPMQRMSAVSAMPKALRTDMQMMKKTTSIGRLAAQQSLSDELPVEDEEAMSVLYAPSMGAFYSGYTPTFSAYNVTFGFAGIRNMIGFGNLSTGIEKSQWSYGYFDGVDADKNIIYNEKTSDAKNLYMPLKPETFISTPVLTATGADGKTESYTAPIARYFCGLSPESWLGDDTEEVDEKDILGTCVYSYVCNEPDLVPMFYKNLKPSAQLQGMFDENGTCSYWAEYLKKQYTGTTFKSVTMNGVGTLIADRPSPYLMRSMWSYFQLECDAEVTLTSHVYEVTEQGIDYEKPIGEAVISFEAGTYPTKSAFEMPIFHYVSLDEDGYETEDPLVIDAFQPIFVTVEGIENEHITQFAMFSTATTNITEEEADLMDYLYPTHALAILDIKFSDGAEAEEKQMFYEDTCPYVFPSEDGTSFYYPCDFMMYFNTSFPTVYNNDEDSEYYETADFEAEIPVDGGSTTFKAFVSYPVEGLIQEQLMTVEASDWLTYTVSTDENTYETTINVTGAAMPSDVKGRVGVVSFKGFACDFDLYVVQGEVSGISNVTATTGKVELFDLQGRKLNAVPANGIYLERNGNVTTKRIARN